MHFTTAILVSVAFSTAEDLPMDIVNVKTVLGLSNLSLLAVQTNFAVVVLECVSGRLQVQNLQLSPIAAELIGRSIHQAVFALSPR